MRNYPAIGVQIPRVLLPRSDICLEKWAVIACDQYTSQPEYWQRVETFVGGSPSTYHLVLPEIALDQPDVETRIERIHATMRQYLLEDIFEPYEGLIYIERVIDGKTRRGLLLALDLECYDYHPGASSLIRATEGTILERVPPRLRIRQGAPLELPHILVLIDDPDNTVIEPLAQARDRLQRRYDFDLMLDSGRLTGYLVDDPALEQGVLNALAALARPETFARKYGVSRQEALLLFAMGDGNHSLATAKTHWEALKPHVSPDHPARYALVEVENLHDPALVFEPIHRVLFNVQRDIQVAMHDYFQGSLATWQPVANPAALIERVDSYTGPDQAIGLVEASGCSWIGLDDAGSNLPVGSLQSFLDAFLKAGGAERIDYVHGAEVTCRLGAKPGNACFYLPAMPKSDLFKTVLLDGALPRKTFSLGEAREKRFYMECRKIEE